MIGKGHTGDWFDTLQSLTPPCVVDPGPLWVGSTVSSAAEMIGNPEAYVVLNDRPRLITRT